jgi:hypothetical protein
LLLSCARRELDTATKKRAGELLQQELDWSFVLKLAERNGLIPLLTFHLNRSFHDAVPAPVLDQLRGAARTNSVRGLVLTMELLEILEVLQTGGVRAIPFKGPTLALQAYGDIALRRFIDLDLLVREGDFESARSLLEQRGYRAHYPLTSEQERDYLAASGHVPLVRSDPDIMVELHTAVTPRAFAFPLDPAPFWNRLVSLPVLEKTLPGLGPEDLFIILCVHGAKHQWESLSLITDVAELIRAQPGLAWPRIVQQARVTRSERILCLGLHLAHHFLEAPLPAELEKLAAHEPHLPELATEIRARLFADALPSPGFWESWRFYRRVRERAWDGWRFCLSMIFSPTVADWTRLRVPAPLSFFYYMFRPVRLLIKYVGRTLCAPFCAGK